MKKLEELVLPNMELIDRYLSGNMAGEDINNFHARLEVDVELREDFEMAKEILGYNPSPWWATPPLQKDQATQMDFNEQRLSRKAAIGKDMISYGLAAVATAAIMVITCAIILYFFT